MKSIYLNCDVIIASNISDYINFVNCTPFKNRQKALQDYKFSIKACIETAKCFNDFSYGKIVSEDKKHVYDIFIRYCKVLTAIDENYFRISDSYIKEINNKIDKNLIIDNIIQLNYDDKVLRKLSIIID